MTKKLKVILAGSSGMVGEGVLLECLDHDAVESVLVINRRPINKSHPKLTEIIHSNFYDVSEIKSQLGGYNALFYCIGISSVGQTEASYTKFTYDMTMQFTQTCLEVNPNLSMVYCSAAGADSSEQGKIMWARVRGKLENDLQKLSLNSIYSIRPAFIEPMRGVKSKTKAYHILITIFRPLFFVLRVFPMIATSTVIIGKCMINAVLLGYEKPVLESRDINRLGNK